MALFVKCSNTLLKLRRNCCCDVMHLGELMSMTVVFILSEYKGILRELYVEVFHDVAFGASFGDSVFYLPCFN